MTISIGGKSRDTQTQDINFGGKAMSEPLLDPREQRRVAELLKIAVGNLENALKIATEAQKRVVNGNPDITIQYRLRHAIKEIGRASDLVRA